MEISTDELKMIAAALRSKGISMVRAGDTEYGLEYKRFASKFDDFLDVNGASAALVFGLTWLQPKETPTVNPGQFVVDVFENKFSDEPFDSCSAVQHECSGNLERALQWAKEHNNCFYIEVRKIDFDGHGELFQKFNRPFGGTVWEEVK